MSKPIPKHKAESRWWYVAGKSGGHILPALTHARRTQGENPALKITFVALDTTLDRTLLEKEEGLIAHTIFLRLSLPKVKNPLSFIRLTVELLSTTLTLIKQLYRERPERIITTGGYAAVPVGILGWVMRIPLELHELNAVPGAAIRFLAPFAQKIFVCFTVAKKQFPAHKTEVMPYPIRFSEKELHGAEKTKSTLLILGGSQGSRFLNGIVEHLELTPLLREQGWSVMHQTPPGEEHVVQALYERLNIPAEVFAYRHDIDQCYSAATTAISRAGAGALFELAWFKIPSIIIPLETATTDHQCSNAEAIAAEHPDQFLVIRQQEVTYKREAAQRFINAHQL